MNVFDLHIGWSDYALEVSGTPLQKYIPSQVSIKKLISREKRCFVGGMCPVEISLSGAKIPRDPIKALRKHINFYKNLAEDSKKISLIKSGKELKEVVSVGLILGLEGCYFVKNTKDLHLLKKVKSHGVRVIGPVWNVSNKLAHSCNDNEKDSGLTKLGEEFIRACNELNIIVDGAHASEKTLRDILNISKRPVIVSHTASASKKSHRRNISDETVKRIANNGGVIGVTFVGEFVGANTIDALCEHILHLIRIAGSQSVCIGSDFDGMENDDVIKGLESVENYSNLASALRRKGLSQSVVDKIFWYNATRFFSSNLD